MQKLYFTKDVIANYNTIPKPEEQKIYRDQVLNGRIYVIDYYYSEFVKHVHEERASMGIVADVAVLGADAAGLISTSKQLKDIFLAISGGLTGVKLSFDKNAFYQMTMPALVTKMDSLRKQQLLTIRTKMQQGTDKYGLSEGLVDINDYFQAGTIPGAIIGIQETAGAAAKEAKEGLEQLVVAYEPDSASKLLDQFWRPDGVFNDENEKEILNWKDQNNLGIVPIVFFIEGGKYKEQREKAVKDLKLPRK
ncbi:MAG: hypothetical protein ACRENT_04255 [Thermodesulfobacteriota bacterium]